MAITHKAARAAALKFANDFRKDVGLRQIDNLIPGRRGNAGRCSLALSLGPGMRCSYELAYTKATSSVAEARKLPPLVSHFVRSFDEGKYPDLTIGPP